MERGVEYSKQAKKALRKMPVPDAKRIREKVLQYASDPASQANNVTVLQGTDFIRLRVGDWRVIIDEDGNVLTVIKIGPRGSVYKP